MGRFPTSWRRNLGVQPKSPSPGPVVLCPCHPTNPNKRSATQPTLISHPQPASHTLLPVCNIRIYLPRSSNKQEASASPTYFPTPIPIPIPILSIRSISLVQQYLKKANKFSKNRHAHMYSSPLFSLSQRKHRDAASQPTVPTSLPPALPSILSPALCNKVGVERHQRTSNECATLSESSQGHLADCRASGCSPLIVVCMLSCMDVTSGHDCFVLGKSLCEMTTFCCCVSLVY